MGNHPTTRSREYREAAIGRRRTYTCCECGVKFQTDRLSPLPDIDKVCPDCRKRTFVYTFTNTRTGRDKEVRASSAELATLRAWQISPNLTFNMKEPFKVETDGG